MFNIIVPGSYDGPGILFSGVNNFEGFERGRVWIFVAAMLNDCWPEKTVNMAVAVNFNLEDVFELTPSFLNDGRVSTFIAPQADGSSRVLKIEIDNEAHPLLPNVYNLAFGPLMRNGGIDDKALLRHANYSRVFSTILLHATIYLDSNRTHYLGIDGSSNGRAYLYYRFMQRNFDYLDKHFNIYGLKYYVRITRLGKTQYQNPFNFEDIQSSLEKIQRGKSIDSGLMYNYFVFNLKSTF